MATTTSPTVLPSRVATARRIATLVLAGSALGALAPAVAAGSSPPSGPGYCQAHLDLQAAIISDPASIPVAIEAVQAALPPELGPAFERLLANAPTDDGPPPFGFHAAYNELAVWIKDNCGFSAVELLAQEYSFGGLPEELPAGPTVMTLTNDGEEVHEVVLYRKADGVDLPATELLAIPGDELLGQFSLVAGIIVLPGEAGSIVADLEPGEYFAVCHLPVGNTPEMVMGSAPAASEAPPASPAAEHPPHFVEGMVQDFTVTA